MGAIRYYLVRAWLWLIFAWEKVRSAAPWKVIFFAWLIQMAVAFVLNAAVMAAFGVTIPHLLDAAINLVVFFVAYILLFKRSYPKGWR